MPTLIQRALIVAVVVFLAILTIKSLTPSVPSSEPSSTAAGTPQASATLPPLPFATDLAAQFSEQTVAPPGTDTQWTSRLELSGTDSQHSNPFKLSGNVVKLHYQLDMASGNQAALLFVFLQPADQPQGQATKFPDAFATSPGEGDKYLSRPPGDYVVNVQTFGATWSVTVDEAQ
ncbi:MAG TPA: hypothetical protein VFC51_14815 [Chloroflexota bacterium]|nr:hypothetical protein [Chloroflexota bacterium]